MSWLLKVFSPREAERLPGPVLVELLDLVYESALLSIVLVGGLVASVSLLLYATGGGRTQLLIGGIGVATTLVRLWDNFAYRRQRPCTAAVSFDWERRFAVGSIGFAAILGALDLCALRLDNPYAPMLIGGLFFGYAAGLIMRIYVRPLVSGACLLVVALPTMLGYGLLVLERDPYVGLIYVTQVVLIGGFTAIGLLTIAESYRTLLAQLLTKRDLATLVGQDPLTKLPNRVRLRSRFDEMTLESWHDGRKLALHCMDLDRFKSVNDTFGHPVGDLLLQAVGNRLARAVKSEDMVARLGGDEFVILQADVKQAEEAEALAQRVIRVVSAPYTIEGHQISVGISVGIALAPQDGFDLDELLARADAALYKTKGGLRGGVVFWSVACQPAAPLAPATGYGLPVPPVAP